MMVNMANEVKLHVNISNKILFMVLFGMMVVSTSFIMVALINNGFFTK
jgi:hypothetical protein